MTRVLTLRPPAKINLSLSVGPRQPDGFHGVSTVLQSIDLSDTLVFTSRPGRFTLVSRAKGIPAGPGNLVWRAAAALWRAIGRSGDPRDAHVRLQKAIPSEAGLGGGSADAAATLVGLNRIWAGGLSRADLIRLSASVGSDVPFFFFGGTAVGTGRGDEVYPVDDIARLGVVLIKPAIGVATADAYRWFDEDAEAGRGTPVTLARVDVGWPTGPMRLGNDLQEPVARRRPVIAEMVAALVAAGASGAAMTGSGSAVFGLFSPAAAPKAAKQVARPGWRVLVARTLRRREAASRLGL